MDEKDIMQRIITLAEQSFNAGNMPFSAVLVRNAKIIAEGTNRVLETNDPSEHAEMSAVRKACQILGTNDLSDCVMYVSGAPCPMCAACMIMAGISKVVCATDVATKDELLTKAPSTEKLYNVLANNYGTAALNYEHLSAYSAPIEALFKQENAR